MVNGHLLKDTESQLHLTQFAMDNASVGIYWLGIDARICYANIHACKSLGYTKEEMLQLSLSDIDQNYPMELWSEHWQQLKQDKTKTFETRHKRKDDVIIPVEVVANYVSSSGYEFNVGFAKDISERKNAELELLKSQAIIESSDDAIITKSLNGIIKSWNHGAEKLFGYTANEAIGRSMQMLVPPDRLNEESEILGRISRGERVDHFETVRCHKNGHLINISTTISPILDNVGKVIGASKIARDITESVKAELEFRIAAIAFESQEGMFITDASCSIIRVNSAFTRITGYPAEEVIGKNPSMFKSGRHDANFYSAMWERIHSAGSWEGEIWNKRRNGEIFPERLTITAVKMADGMVTHYVSTLTDITMSKAATDEIKYLAFYDPLTGLANRRLMSDRMEQIISHARRAGELVAICMIDLDGFKQVNDEKGHEAGDQLLIEVAKRLQECIRESDTASRFGGDEFAVTLGGFKETSECLHSITRILSALSGPYIVDNQIARVTGSIGATIFPNDGGNPDQLLRHADEAMYEAKHSGKNCYRLFNPSLMNQIDANQAAFKKIEIALDKGQLTLYYQPQVDCRNAKVTGIEALIRWNHPILGLLPPSDFIPLIEHHDLIITIGEWVIQNALQQLVTWQSNGIIDITVSINISSRQLHQIDFIDRLKTLLDGYDADIIRRLEIEVLETSVLEDVNAIAEAIKKCREMGVRIAIDDFGTGFSSLAHLKKIPFDVIKIDKSFVLGMLRNPEDLVLVNSVIGLGSSFKRKVVAEGVESIDHVLMLLELGCNIMQGYEIARPMPADQIPAWIEKFEPDPLWNLGNSPRPSRDYFEMLLAEVNHRHWIELQIEEFGDPDNAFNSELLQDHRQCRFGRWFYGDGYRQFGSEAWFLSMESLHQRIHQTAVRLCKHKRGGQLAEVKAEEAILRFQQDELDLLLRSLRSELSDKFLMDQSTKSHGDQI